jgi:hypothetical protein
VEDIELDSGHTVEGALDNGDGLEVAAAVDHEAAPAEAGRVLYGDSRYEVAGVVILHELQEGLEAVHGADIGRRFEVCAAGGYVERIGFVFIDALDGLAGTVDGDEEGRGFGCSWRARDL